MTFALGQSVIDRNPHNKAKRGIIGKVVRPTQMIGATKVIDSHGVSSLVHVEWPDGSRSWIVETRLEAR